MNKTYIPSNKILQNYAKVLVDFALGGGAGIKHNEVVWIHGSEISKPLLFEIYKAVLKSGGHPILDYVPDQLGMNFEKEFYLNAKTHQIEFFPAKYMRGVVDEVDHMIFVLSDTDMKALADVDPKKIMIKGHARKPYMEWRDQKEHEGRFTWTIALYGTPAMASEAGMSEKQYWQQIINACFLNQIQPIKHWQQVAYKQQVFIKKLNQMKIDKVHVEGEDVDLWIKIGNKRKWLGGSGRNIPSFEIFTSPDWRGTEGWIKFNQPLYRYGNLVKGIELKFKDGKVVWSKADHNEKLIKQMIATPNADKVGEFSLTDKRFSRITKFMAETLFDENIGGPNGNTHIALGAAYVDTFDGDPAKLTKIEKEKLGYNDSSVHTDMISTTPRTVTAYLPNGTKKVIYKNGEFQL